jgi:membrane protein implicated in regulation of membrane protease activity
VKTFGGEVGAAISAFAVLFGLAAVAFAFAFLFGGWWVDLVVAVAFGVVAVALWQLSMRRTALASAPPARRGRRGARRRGQS